MVVRVIEAKEDKVTMADLIADLKKSNKVDYSGAIFTFEGIVRGKEENMNLEIQFIYHNILLGFRIKVKRKPSTKSRARKKP